MRCHAASLRATLARRPSPDSYSIGFDDREGPGQLLIVLPNASNRDPGLLVIRETMKAKQDHAMVGEALPKDELTEVLVGRDHDRHVCLGDREDFVIADSGLQLRDIGDIMALRSKSVDDRALDPLVAHELQEGYVGMG